MSITVKKRYLYAGITLLLLLIAASALFWKEKNKKEDYLTIEGLLKLPVRESVNYNAFPYEENENYTLSKVVYESASADISAFLLEPKREGKVPGVVLLPGAGVDKMSELPLARTIASQGYAVITIDYRGIGESQGYLPSLEQDYESYKKGVVASWHLVIIDALIAADVLSTQENVDSGKIILVGESFGARTAMIAAAIDSRMKGVVSISGSGFHYQGGSDAKKDRFISSLDADNYVSKLSPRTLMMIHNAFDKSIPVQSAAITFEKALDPKLFILLNDSSCGHGYCESMLRPLNFSLAAIAGS